MIRSRRAPCRRADGSAATGLDRPPARPSRRHPGQTARARPVAPVATDATVTSPAARSSASAEQPVGRQPAQRHAVDPGRDDQCAGDQGDKPAMGPGSGAVEGEEDPGRAGDEGDHAGLDQPADQRRHPEARVRQHREALAAETGETADLWIDRREAAELVDEVVAGHELRIAADRGLRLPRGSTAPGKAVLAGLSESEAVGWSGRRRRASGRSRRCWPRRPRCADPASPPIWRNLPRMSAR